MANLDAVKAKLEAQLEELLGRANEIEGALSTPGSSDWEENAIESEDDEVLASVGDVTRSEIQEIRIALERIATGQYGKCISCQRPIGKERLEALPYATTCVDCA